MIISEILPVSDGQRFRFIKSLFTRNGTHFDFCSSVKYLNQSRAKWARAKFSTLHFQTLWHFWRHILVCCIFHKPKANGESSSESSDSSDDDISPLERMPKGL